MGAQHWKRVIWLLVATLYREAIYEFHIHIPDRNLAFHKLFVQSQNQSSSFMESSFFWINASVSGRCSSGQYRTGRVRRLTCNDTLYEQSYVCDKKPINTSETGIRFGAHDYKLIWLVRKTCVSDAVVCFIIFEGVRTNCAQMSTTHMIKYINNVRIYMH